MGSKNRIHTRRARSVVRQALYLSRRPALSRLVAFLLRVPSAPLLLVQVAELIISTSCRGNGARKGRNYTSHELNELEARMRSVASPRSCGRTFPSRETGRSSLCPPPRRLHFRSPPLTPCQTTALPSPSCTTTTPRSTNRQRMRTRAARGSGNDG